MKVRFLAPALIEFDEAAAFYETQRRGLGRQFAAEVENALARVALFPEGYQAIGKYSRRCIVARFPYGLIYQLRQSNSQILVVAVAHLHRRPDYWQPRES